MPIPLVDLQIHSEMPAKLYQPSVAQLPLILVVDEVYLDRGLFCHCCLLRRWPSHRAHLHPAALRSLLLFSSPLGTSRQREFVGKSSRNASSGYLHPRLLIGEWEEDDPRAGSVYKYAGSDLDTCRSIIVVDLAIYNLSDIVISLGFDRRAHTPRDEIGMSRAQDVNFSVLAVAEIWNESRVFWIAELNIIQIISIACHCAAGHYWNMLCRKIGHHLPSAE